MKVLHDIDFMIPLCIGLFWSAVFLQSGLDKIFDYKGNLDWLKGHFKNTFLAKTVTPALIILTVLELSAGLCSLIGSVFLILGKGEFWIEQGVILCMVSLVMLIAGQRIAKDYDGAKTIAIYFGVALLSAFILSN